MKALLRARTLQTRILQMRTLQTRVLSPWARMINLALQELNAHAAKKNHRRSEVDPELENLLYIRA
jgi:hypothetical protein